MGAKLGIALRKARTQRKLTLKDIAARVGVQYPAVQQWEVGKTTPSRENAPKVAEAYGIDLSALHHMLDKEDSLIDFLKPTTPSELEAEEISEVARIAALTRLHNPKIHNTGNNRIDIIPYTFADPVPVYGSVMGGNDVDFYISSDIVEYTDRPPGARQIKRLYALHILGESMIPRFEPGDMIYVNPDRSPALGEYAVIELVGEDTEHGRGGIVKRLVRRTPQKLVLEQFNPAKEFEVDAAEVRAVHRVVPWRELLGK